jgi:hypothetical protein
MQASTRSSRPRTCASARPAACRIIPAPIDRGYQAAGRQRRHPGLRSHHRGPRGPPPPPPDRDHAQRLAHGAPHQGNGVFDPARTPQRRATQRRPQRPRRKPARPRRKPARALDQPPVQPRPDQPGAEAHQGPLGKRRPVCAHPAPAASTGPRPPPSITSSSPTRHTPARSPPAPAAPAKPAAAPFRAAHIPPRQLGPKLLIKQPMPVLSNEDQQLRPPHRLDHRLPRRRRLHRQTPDTPGAPNLPARSQPRTTRYQHDAAHPTAANPSYGQTHYRHYSTGALGIPPSRHRVRYPPM